MVSSTLGIPPSSSIVTVKALSVGRVISPASLFFTPVHPAYPNIDVPVWCFLLEHAPTGKRLLFDLGLRVNVWENCTPLVRSFSGFMSMPCEEGKDIVSQLKDGGVELESIDAFIWSHAHIDHIGDPSLFPPSVDLIVGEGFSESKLLLPTYPENQGSVLLESDLKDRKITEIPFSKSTLTIAGLNAYDYFGDGSFYLLDTPGHFPAHITALARTTSGGGSSAGDSTFVLLGGDACHHSGQLRPSLAHPCPVSLHPRLSSLRALPFDESSTEATNDAKAVTLSNPPLHHTTDPTTTVHIDPPTAIASAEKLQALDGDPDVFVLLAHDPSLEGVIPLFPEALNGWKEKASSGNNAKERTAWAWLEEGDKAFRFEVI